MLWTRADLSFALVNNLELLTHYTKRAENERCFSRQTEMRKKPRYEKIYGYGVLKVSIIKNFAWKNPIFKNLALK